MSARRRLAFCLPFLVGVALVGACKDDETRPPVSGGGISTPVGGSTEAGARAEASAPVDSSTGADGSVCTELVQAGNLIDKIGVNGDPPIGLGGAIVDGTYTLTDDTAYLGDTGIPGTLDNQKRATIRISGGLAIEQIIETRSSTTLPVIQTSSSTYSVVTPTFTRSDSCPVGAATYTYTATDTTLKLTDLSSKEAFTYTLH